MRLLKSFAPATLAAALFAASATAQTTDAPAPQNTAPVNCDALDKEMFNREAKAIEDIAAANTLKMEVLHDSEGTLSGVNMYTPPIFQMNDAYVAAVEDSKRQMNDFMIEGMQTQEQTQCPLTRSEIVHNGFVVALNTVDLLIMQAVAQYPQNFSADVIERYSDPFDTAPKSAPNPAISI